jgi:hypothetical protein
MTRDTCAKLQHRILHVMPGEKSCFSMRPFANYNIAKSICIFVQYSTWRNSAIGKATGCGLDGRGIGVLVPIVAKDFDSAAHPASYAYAAGGSIPGVKRLEHEADYSLPANTKIKIMWNFPQPPPYVFIA